MLDDFMKSVRAQLYERVSSPLSGVFVLSWLAWNYRFLLVIFSEMKATEKLNYIQGVLYADWLSGIGTGLLGPAITTGLWVYLYPIPARYVFEHVRKQQRILKEIRQQIDEETPISKEEARKMRREASEASEAYEELIERQSNEIRKLKEEIKEIETNSDMRTGSTFEAVKRRVSGTQPTATSPSIHVAAGSERSKKRYSNSRLLLNPTQLMDNQIKEFISNEPSLGKRQFLVEVDDKKVVVSRLPEEPPGPAERFEHGYVSTGSIDIWSEIERVKRELLKDLVEAKEG